MRDIDVQLAADIKSARIPLPAGTQALALLAAVAAAALIVLVLFMPGEHRQTVALAILALLATFGTFAVFALSAGLVRLRPGTDLLPQLLAHAEASSEGLQLTTRAGVPSFTNAAFARVLCISEAQSHKGLVLALGGHPGMAEPIYRLVRAASLGIDGEERLDLGGEAAGDVASSRQILISISHGQPKDGEPVVIWRARSAEDVDEKRRPAGSEALASPATAALDVLPTGAFVLDKDDQVVAANAALATLLAQDRGRLNSGKLSASTLLSEATSRQLARLRTSETGSEPASIDAELRRGDETPFPARIIACRLDGKSGAVLALVLPAESSAPAITEAAQSRFSKFFHAAPIAIATVDRDGRIGSANPAFTRMFWQSAEPVMVAGMSLFERLATESREAVRGLLATAPDTAGSQAPVEIHFGASGKSAGHLYVSAVRPSAGERDGTIVYAIDTTQQKELESQFTQSQKMQAVGQLAGGIAHDFNNVLTVIIGFSDLLLANHRPTDPAHRDILAIKQNANRAASLVRQLLAFSRRQTLRPEVLSLPDVISDLSIFMSRILGEKVTLKVSHGRDLWFVKADITQFDQVIMNLAVNARDAMPDGGKLTIKTHNLAVGSTDDLPDKEVPPGEYVVCQVTDTGCGMTPEVMAKIFEPFFSTKEVGKGTGLGLSTVYGIVKQTGGYIYCDSTPGSGTTFRIYLPRHIEDGTKPAITVKPEKKDKPRDLTGTGTVLLVEDEEAVRRFAARALTRQGYRVLEAGTGTEALEVMATHGGSVDLVVSDIVMPEMDGPALLKELRKTNPTLKIIFISGYAEDALKSLQGGEEFAFLPKPFQLKDLVTTVKETIEG